MRKVHKGNLALRFASILFICVGLSTFMLAGLLARYTTSGLGEDEANVAIFKVEALGTPKNDVQEITEDYVHEYELVLKNSSEVAVRCDIDIIFEDALDACYQVTLDGLTPMISSDKKTYSFKSVHDFSPGESEIVCELLMTMDYDEWVKNANALSYNEELIFKVGVTFTQID